MTQTYRISQGSGPSRLFAGVVSVLVLAFGLLALSYGLRITSITVPDVGLVPAPDPQPKQPTPIDDPQIDPTSTANSEVVVAEPQIDVDGTDDPGAVQGSSGVSAAFIGTPALPAYPPSSIANCEQGKVGLMLHIGADGRVVEAVVASSSGYPALDDAALRAAQKWHFKPATVNGIAVDSTLNKTITFNLKDEVGATMTQAQLRECLKGQ